MKSKKDSKKKKKRKKSEEKQEARLEEEIKQAEKEIEQVSDRNRLKEEPLANSPLTSQIKQEFFEEPIRQIPISAETSAPVLERIIERQMPMQNLIEIEQPREAKEEAGINYSLINEPNYGFTRNKEDEKEKKYETNFVPPVLTRREMSEDIKREFLKPQTETWGNQTNEPQLDEIDFIEEETRLPFEEQQKKYKRAKLR